MVDSTIAVAYSHDKPPYVQHNDNDDDHHHYPHQQRQQQQQQDVKREDLDDQAETSVVDWSPAASAKCAAHEALTCEHPDLPSQIYVTCEHPDLPSQIHVTCEHPDLPSQTPDMEVLSPSTRDRLATLEASLAALVGALGSDHESGPEWSSDAIEQGRQPESPSNQQGTRALTPMSTPEDNFCFEGGDKGEDQQRTLSPSLKSNEGPRPSPPPAEQPAQPQTPSKSTASESIFQRLFNFRLVIGRSKELDVGEAEKNTRRETSEIVPNGCPGEADIRAGAHHKTVDANTEIHKADGAQRHMEEGHIQHAYQAGSYTNSIDSSLSAYRLDKSSTDSNDSTLLTYGHDDSSTDSNDNTLLTYGHDELFTNSNETTLPEYVQYEACNVSNHSSTVPKYVRDEDCADSNDSNTLPKYVQYEDCADSNDSNTLPKYVQDGALASEDYKDGEMDEQFHDPLKLGRPDQPQLLLRNKANPDEEKTQYMKMIMKLDETLNKLSRGSRVLMSRVNQKEAIGRS